ncbi:MAG: bifunctional (p)ppGpp synthetase/guanosine-3',5'-bis(diphosphate) 3'-pyrophosphohydrolase [Alphaproteobacteria bacterium]
MIRQYELVERVRAYDPQVDEDLLNRAYVYAMKAHGSQKRASGDPYFSHPLEVAGILTEMRMDASTIATALLHDTIEDTEATYEELEQLFGAEVADMVEGVTKLTQIEDQPRELKQAENFRKLVLALSKDIRVLMVKLADRVHNMRTLHFCKPEKRGRIARETMEIYAPLAERIGISKMKEELEELSFRQLHPEAWEPIIQRLEMLRDSDDNVVERIIDSITTLMQDNGLEADVKGREKTPYSIYRKMRSKQVGFEQLSDIMAFRIVVETVGDCYHALGLIHSSYQVTPGRFKDYISTPKPNGYKSLHTTVVGPEGKRIEVQIRTREMHEIADLGVAAHWAYKQGDQPKKAPDAKHWRWLRELVELVETAEMPDEFIEHAKMELFAEEVFAFTPTGDVINLPQGATVVDFAYAIHSDVGDRCVGGRVNGRMVPLQTQLANGDQVDISTSKNQTPSPAWLRFVKTGKARARIRKFKRETERDQWASLGKAMMQKMFSKEGYEFSDKAIANVLTKIKPDTVEDTYAAVGSGLMAAKDLFNTIFPGHRSQQQQAQTTGKVPFDPNKLVEEGSVALKEPEQKTVPKKKGRKGTRKKPGRPVPLTGLIPGMAVHFARCCHPIPGDRIVGIISTGRGVTVHVTDCETLAAFEDAPERWLDVGWETDQNGNQVHVGRLSLVVNNETGTLASISNVIAKNGGNISNLKIIDRQTDFWTMLVDVEVTDAQQLTDIIAALRATPSINSVERAQGR